MAKAYPHVNRSRRPLRWCIAALLVLGCIGLVTRFWQLPPPSPDDPAEPTEISRPGSPPPLPSPASPPPAPHVAAPAPATPAVDHRQPHSVIGHDRFATVTPLAERWVGRADAERLQRWRLVPTGDAIIPLARVVDHLVRDPEAPDTWLLHAQEVMRPDAVMVGIPAGVPPAVVAARLHESGFVTEAAQPSAAVVVVRLSAATLDAVPAALARLRAELPVFLAEPDFLRFPAQATPNDYDANVLWSLENIEAPGAWTVTTGSTSVVVAVLDSGLEATHPDLAPNLWTNPGEIPGNGIDDDQNGRVDDVHGWDFAANSSAIIDNDGHGTHVSGILGAAGNNGQGVTGVNWRVQILPLRCGDGTFPDSTLANAIAYIVDLKRNRSINVVAINASLGGSGFNSALRSAIASAGAEGINFAAAAGNDGVNNDVTPTYPASYDLDNIIAVASIHQGNARSRFSNYGATTVDLAAPGTAVFSTQRTSSFGHQNGTSMATPHVTGALALIAAAEPGLTAAQRRTRILQTVDPVPALAGVVATGGKLNLRRAVAPGLLRPRVAITQPAARVVTMDRAGLSLAFAAAVLPDGANTALATLAWDAPDAPSPVNFSATAGSGTVATFPGAGRYRVRVRAMAGALQESDEIIVAIGGVEPDATGLRARWSFNELSGNALDSSGENRTGTLSTTSRTRGVLGSGLSLNGTTSNVAFAAPALSRVTIAGWARATAAGNSIFPRVLHMRPGLLFFGLDGGASTDDGNNGTLKFALDDGSATPVWHTPPGTIGLNTWYHVAVSYDPAASAPAPRLYINGVRQGLGTQASGAAVAPGVAAGQGFIGDRGDATRVWQGQLDEIRLYDRELAPAEMALLGHEVTLHAVTAGTLWRGPHHDPYAVPLVFAPAATGLAPPSFVHTAWSVAPASGVTFAPASGMGTTMTVPDPGDYLVRFDGLTGDGVYVVRTLEVTVWADSVTTPGYYQGTTSDGGVFVLLVADDGVGTFYGGVAQGGFRHGFSVAPWGGFSFTDQTGTNIGGRIDETGSVTGTLASPAGAAFAGTRLGSGFGAVQPALDGDYAGWVLDSGTRAVAHVERGRVVLVVQESGVNRAAEGVIDAAGGFSLAPATDATFTGHAGADKLTADITMPGQTARRMTLFRTGFAPARRLINLSLRGVVGTGDSVLIPGFVVRGSDPLPMLVRAVGPGLDDFDVPGSIAQPRMQLFSGSTMLFENLGWDTALNATDIAAAAQRVNAFALDPTKLDSALYAPLIDGNYTVTITGADGGAGVALAEAYDARQASESARLINLSGRGNVGTGANVLIGGFVVGGDTPALVLVRGIGPGLAAFGVSGALQEPVLTVFRGQTPFASGSSWTVAESAADVAAAAALTSAFPLATDSADAALLLFLEPGGYTAQVSGAHDSTGIALVEIYLVPDF